MTKLERWILGAIALAVASIYLRSLPESSVWNFPGLLFSTGLGVAGIVQMFKATK